MYAGLNCGRVRFLPLCIWLCADCKFMGVLTYYVHDGSAISTSVLTVPYLAVYETFLVMSRCFATVAPGPGPTC